MRVPPASLWAGSTGPPARRSHNGHLHLALLVALGAASLLALAAPIKSTGTSEAARAAPAPGGGLASALRRQAEAVAAVLASPPAVDRQSAVSTDPPPGSMLHAVMQVAAGSVFGTPEMRQALVLREPDAVPFTLHAEGLVARYSSSEMTVGQALAGLGIEIGQHDFVLPDPATRLTPGVHVYVSYATNLRLIFDGEEKIVYTRTDTVADLLNERGIATEPSDRIFPQASEPIRRGMSIVVTTVREGTEFTEDPIGYETVYRYDAAVKQGERRLVQTGSDGYIRREFQVKRVNGNQTVRDLVSEYMIAPTEEIIVIGTGVEATPPPAAAAAPAPRPLIAVDPEPLNCVETLNVYATWYTAASAGGTTTATGTGVYKGIVAVDPAVIPLGTRMYIPGYGYGLAADTGSAIRGHMIDLAYGPDDVKDWRTRWVDICILG